MTGFFLRVEDLPSPPPGRTGFPWTEGTRRLPDTLPGGKSYPKISVVTPSYQQGQYLEETIRSVLLQGYPNLEYLVIDGGSQDNSVGIIQKYAPFLAFWLSERDRGQAQAINKGFAHSGGEIMGWLNSDDILLPNALYWIARTFEEQPHTNFVTGFRKIIDEDSHITRNFVRDVPTNHYLSHYCCVAQETTYWRRYTWDKLGPLDETLHFALDYEYWLRALHNGESFHLIPHYLGGFRDYIENKSSSWLSVYYRDMNVLYRRYAMGNSEADVHAKLGRRWALRYPFYLRISEQSWTNSPRLVQLAWRALETPFLCDSIILMWKLHWTYREFRQTHHQSRWQALRFTLALVVDRAINWRLAAAQPEAPHWGDVRGIADCNPVDAQVSLSPLPNDTLAFGKNWYPTELYSGEYFRWSSGSSEICVVKATGKRTRLKLILAPGLPSDSHKIDLLDKNGTLILSIAAIAAKLEIDIVLPPVAGPHVSYQLRWSGSTISENSPEKRRLAFRILGIGWHDSTIPEPALNSLQHTVDSLLARRIVDNIPVLGRFICGGRRLHRARRIMVAEIAFWQQLTENLDTLDTELHAQESSTPEVDADSRSP